MFDCGINETIGDMVSSIETEKEKLILKAVQSVGIDVDKEQLKKALFNAKSFYNDGYEDAKKQYEQKCEHHIDHTDCIWYGNDSGCPVTCSQYRDGWNDAMDYIFKNGDGYRPYRRNENG